MVLARIRSLNPPFQPLSMFLFLFLSLFLIRQVHPRQRRRQRLQHRTHF